jgi:hypothetical protein
LSLGGLLAHAVARIVLGGDCLQMGGRLFKLEDDIMYIERNGNRIVAAYLDEQFRGQEWLPIESRALQAFLATAPSVGRRRWRPSLRVARDWQLAL